MAFSFWNKKKKETTETRQQITELPLEQIVPNRFQPRKVFADDKLSELAETIKEHGLLQPIVVRQYEPEHYEIIAGERRFRAVTQLGWAKVPALIKEMSDTEAASMAVIENLQREGLTAIEEAKAYKELMELNKLIQSELAQAIGKSQSFVANKLRLLKLTDFGQQAILERKITERHGRAVLSLTAKQQEEVLQQVIAKKMTVKETEKLVQQMTQKVKKSPAKKRSKGSTSDVRVAVNTIKKALKMINDNGMKIKIHEEDQPDFHQIIIDIPLEKKGKEDPKKN
ncbi:nucleoid occlusion protein [Liquorilactobacillus capillatus]|uniref:Chromosome partitioning protein, DNA-binding protein n=1 Tax=Liquorilactobacillus capillatus DSM 19910 TaxID=1423731 RepID=A0A0R1MBQ3_9LACO|nr:nucleoid occlusion protein [Liquorilactobacillus capillatus]KRL00824.1 chromosome partitioning protein, DNA-binding protein [Liquorilactobacillus capillatus DSM 19910]